MLKDSMYFTILILFQFFEVIKDFLCTSFQDFLDFSMMMDFIQKLLTFILLFFTILEFHDVSRDGKLHQMKLFYLKYSSEFFKFVSKFIDLKGFINVRNTINYSKFWNQFLIESWIRAWCKIELTYLKSKVNRKFQSFWCLPLFVSKVLSLKFLLKVSQY